MKQNAQKLTLQSLAHAASVKPVWHWGQSCLGKFDSQVQ